jgi:hypothetical protein
MVETENDGVRQRLAAKRYARQQAVPKASFSTYVDRTSGIVVSLVGYPSRLSIWLVPIQLKRRSIY